ncbi:MAG TPA: condensation domain-containing protein, partial [Thermoanaerobaculia bacterium]|nr:condensation domain-containing protein [Thermoanaerobaculia bacterium]
LSIPIGRPLSNTTAYLVDPAGELATLGQTGELYIGGRGGAGLAEGYLGRPELTAERFVPDPCGTVPGGRLYRTGDLARRRAGGEIEFLGRLDQQVKIRGFRIEPGEVEAAVAACPGVREAAVVVRRDGGEPRLVAYVAGGDLAEIRQRLRQRLPHYLMPEALVALPELPRTLGGKLDRGSLPAPDGGASYTAPAGEIEELVAGLWGEMLGRDRVGAEDNFFELGGHSLLATRLISRLRAVCGVELPLASLFESPTVAGLAAEVERAFAAAAGPEAPPIAPRQEDGKPPLSFAQQRLWFLAQLDPGSAVYNVPVALRLRGQLDRAAFAASCDAITARHETLRTTFVPGALGEAVQRIAPHQPQLLPLVDLGALQAARREEEAHRLATAEAGRPFDLARGPLMRLALLRLADEEHVALLTLHHIVCDGWSMGVLLDELAVLYRALAPLPPLPVQYADFACWQRAWLQGEALEVRLGYWRQRLDGAPPVLELPVDRPRPVAASGRGVRLPVHLPAEPVAALAAAGRRAGATLFMVLLAAWKGLLARLTGQDDLVVGTPIANRNRVEIEGLIGCFANTLALRTDLSGEPDFPALVGRVRATALAAYAHQDLPFERLVEELAPERNLAHAPLFQVMFVLQNAPLGRLALPGLQLEPLAVDAGVARFDLTLSLDGTTGTLEVDLDLFDATTAARLIRSLETLLTAAAAEPERPVADLPLLSAAESGQLREWNATDRAWPSDACLHDLVLAQAARTPGAAAVIGEDETLTYGELARQAGLVAGRLRAGGIGPGAVVGLCVERSPEMVVGMLGILIAGAAYLPLDPDLPPGRLAFMVEDAGVPLVLTREDLVELPSPPVRVPEASPADLAYVIYTSGSTGRPKGVMVPHRAIVNRLLWMQDAYRLTAADRVLQKTPFGFDVSVWEIF